MANFLVVIELVDGNVPPTSLEILGQARRTATELGATVFALLALPQLDTEKLDELGDLLGHHGADRVIAATATDDKALPTDLDLHWGTIGPQILGIIETVPPRLVLFSLSPSSREVAPRLAARLSAGYAYDGWFEVQDGHLRIGEGETAFDADVDFPVVATIGPGRYPVARATLGVEVDLLPTASNATEFEPIATSVPLSPTPDARGIAVGHVALLGEGDAPLQGLCAVASGGRRDRRANFVVEEPLAEVLAVLSPTVLR